MDPGARYYSQPLLIWRERDNIWIPFKTEVEFVSLLFPFRELLVENVDVFDPNVLVQAVNHDAVLVGVV